MNDCADIADPDRMQQRVQEIRAIIHEAGGSPRFRAVARGLAPIVAGNFFREVPGALAVSRTEMPRVGAAVAAGDADGAIAAYGAMMRAHGDLVVDILRSR